MTIKGKLFSFALLLGGLSMCSGAVMQAIDSTVELNKEQRRHAQICRLAGGVPVFYGSRLVCEVPGFVPNQTSEDK